MNEALESDVADCAFTEEWMRPRLFWLITEMSETTEVPPSRGAILGIVKSMLACARSMALSTAVPKTVFDQIAASVFKEIDESYEQAQAERS